MKVKWIHKFYTFRSSCIGSDFDFFFCCWEPLNTYTNLLETLFSQYFFGYVSIFKIFEKSTKIGRMNFYKLKSNLSISHTTLRPFIYLSICTVHPSVLTLYMFFAYRGRVFVIPIDDIIFH